ncbi:MAG TPA: hypothetical protein VII84_08010 [Acidimicrobiales bacterium]
MQTNELSMAIDAHGFVLTACPSCGTPMQPGDARAKCIESIERFQESDAVLRQAYWRIDCRACLPTVEADALEAIDADFDDEDLGQDAAAYVIALVVTRHYRGEIADLPLQLRESVDRTIEEMRHEGRRHE